MFKYISNKCINIIILILILNIILLAIIRKKKFFENFEDININSVNYSQLKRDESSMKSFYKKNVESKKIKLDKDYTTISKHIDKIKKLELGDKLDKFIFDDNTNCIFENTKYKIPGIDFKNYKCINGQGCHKACADHCDNDTDCYSFIVHNKSRESGPIQDDDITSCWSSNLCHNKNNRFLKNNEKNYSIFTKKDLPSLEGLAKYGPNLTKNCNNITPIKTLSLNDLKKKSNESLDDLKKKSNETLDDLKKKSNKTFNDQSNQCALECSSDLKCKVFHYNYLDKDKTCKLYDNNCNSFVDSNNPSSSVTNGILWKSINYIDNVDLKNETFGFIDKQSKYNNQEYINSYNS